MSLALKHGNKFIVPPGIYLASHSVGAMTRRGQDYLTSKYIKPWTERGGDGWENWLALSHEFCAALGGILGGKAPDFCPQTNLSSGFTKYLMALPTPARRKKIVMHYDAFPSMGFAAAALERQGYELSLIPRQLPAHDPQVWAEALGEHTACALITHVHSNTGVLSPVADIIDICKSKGVRPLVDIAQSAGIIPIDLSAWNADAVFGSCVKWLCGGPGAGFMWVNPNHAQTLRPVDVGWFSHASPFDFDITDFTYAEGARRFWGGTPNIAPYAAALGGKDTLAEIGVEAIRAHNIAMMKIVHPDVNPALNGGTLCLPVTDVQDAALREAGCQFDRRGNIARLSFHIYNGRDEAEQLRKILLNPKTSSRDLLKAP